jgi:hypothetical protein
MWTISKVFNYMELVINGTTNGSILMVCRLFIYNRRHSVCIINRCIQYDLHYMEDEMKPKAGDVIRTCGKYYLHSLFGKIISVNRTEDVRVIFFPNQDFKQFSFHENEETTVLQRNYEVVGEITELEKVLYGFE